MDVSKRLILLCNENSSPVCSPQCTIVQPHVRQVHDDDGCPASPRCRHPLHGSTLEENVNRQSTVRLQEERVLLTFKDLISDWKMHSNGSKPQINVKNMDKTTAIILPKSSWSG